MGACAIYVRWLGAFRRMGTLHQSLNYELNRRIDEEVAVERIDEKSFIDHARVGLLIDKKAVVKKFNGDCWSEYNVGGKLCKTRRPTGLHREAWAHPAYTAIVVSCGIGRPDGEGFYNLSKKVQNTIKWYSELYNLPILNLVGCELKPIK